MLTQKRVIQGLFIFSIFLVAIGFTGCGQKGPPLPAQAIGQVIADPYDLKADLKDNMAFLTWSHRIDPVDAHIKPEHFDVFMARKTFDACRDCPFQFQQIGTVFMPKKEFITQVEKGYKYYFRVQAVGKDNLKSGYSKTIQLESK
ncbi:MAG: lipoprotein [Pseudomonadota bacterium]